MLIDEGIAISRQNQQSKIAMKKRLTDYAACAG
jgi:hypothetical protein